MKKQGKVFYKEKLAGLIEQNDEGYQFVYDTAYLDSAEAKPVSATLPLQKETFVSKTMFPFFDGLIPEGWLLNIAEKNWKLDRRDRMALLLHCCKDCIGAVSVQAMKE